MDRGTEKGKEIMKRLLNNLRKKNKYYNELLKITSGMIYDIQNSGREKEFEMLVEKRAQIMKAIDTLDAERRQIISGFGTALQPHIKNLVMCKERPTGNDEKAVYDIAQENRMLLRKISSYTHNLDMQVKAMMAKTKI